MNYLAHSLLAEPYPESIIGNIAGDLVKGPLRHHQLHPRVADGVRRHRRIDVLTDRDPNFQVLRALFPGTQRRTAGIVLDVLFDYFLHKHWSRFSDWSLDDFIADVYSVLSAPNAPLPAPLARVAPRWVEADWLRVYASIEGVSAVLVRLESRMRIPLDIRSSLALLDQHEDELESGFIAVFANVQSQIEGRWLQPVKS